jgi:hypothetical protein
MLFGKKKDKPPKDTNSVEFRLYMCRKLDGQALRYVLERNDESTAEIVLGKKGVISLYNGDLSVVCGEKTVFCCTAEDVSAWEFMSLDGAVITGFDKTVNKVRTIHAYYTYYRD